MTAIHYINHNFSDWDSQTKHMNRLERSIYLDLRTLYFSNAGVHNGRIDASDFALLCYRLSCHSDEEINALKLILKDKFKKNGNTYRHSDWDKQIKAIQWEIKKGNVGNEIGNVAGNVGNEIGNVTGNDRKPLSNAERTAKNKAERKQLLSELTTVGVDTPVNTPISELRQLYQKHIANIVGNVAGNVGNAQKPSNKTITINHKPINTHTNAREQNFDVQQVLNLWNPPLQQINDALRVSGEQDISEQQFNHIKLEFLSHYKTKLENQTLRPEQLFGKFVSWIKRSKSHSVTHGVKTNETHQSNRNHETVSEYRERLYRGLQEQTGYDFGYPSTEPEIIDGDYRDVC